MCDLNLRTVTLLPNSPPLSDVAINDEYELFRLYRNPVATDPTMPSWPRSIRRRRWLLLCRLSSRHLQYRQLRSNVRTRTHTYTHNRVENDLKLHKLRVDN